MVFPFYHAVAAEHVIVEDLQSTKMFHLVEGFFFVLNPNKTTF